MQPGSLYVECHIYHTVSINTRRHHRFSKKMLTTLVPSLKM
jgi:hypothetical protein